MNYLLPSLTNNELILDYSSLFSRTYFPDNPLSVKERFVQVKECFLKKEPIEKMKFPTKFSIIVMENLLSLDSLASSYPITMFKYSMICNNDTILKLKRIIKKFKSKSKFFHYTISSTLNFYPIHHQPSILGPRPIYL